MDCLGLKKEQILKNYTHVAFQTIYEYKLFFEKLSKSSDIYLFLLPTKGYT